MPGLKVCPVRGCPNLTSGRWCQVHSQSAGHHLYNSKRWKLLRDAVRVEQPFCQEPGCRRLTDHVDHIVPHRGDVELFYQKTNLQGLCVEHHGAKTKRGE
jgi:5-methylcytosine-specific restriction protein A